MNGTACSCRTARRSRSCRSSTPRSTQALGSPEVSARFKQLNIVSRQNTPEEFHEFVEEQMKLWSGVVKEANIHLG